ncbi:hypothetical protein ACFZDK_54120 [Streptomyces sp. NPDC007901]|uniref:hypothetical protein n=1 Tax=Streptomyces sp. NPDC007901 TaxID=3364785 RepID=UPI0036E58804
MRLTGQGVGKYLLWWGLSFQRPDKRAVAVGAETVRVWREETWRPIQVGIRSDPVTDRSSSPGARSATFLRSGSSPPPSTAGGRRSKRSSTPGTATPRARASTA